MAGETSLYERDILLWTEQQAAALRALAARPDLPNALDLPNVIEEIEALGRSELKAATSPIRLMLGHLVKLACRPESPARQHWVGEVLNWHRDVQDSLSPSMHQRVDLPTLWRRACSDARRALDLDDSPPPPPLPDQCPLALDDFLVEEFDIAGAVARIRAAGGD